MNKYQKFKCLLEYFVAHLEYIQNDTLGNEIPNKSAYKKYIEPLLSNFSRTGQGYRGDNIQQQISSWDKYEHGKIHISVQISYGRCNTRASYLHWESTGYNIIAKWDENNSTINALEVGDINNKLENSIVYKTSDIGLYDEQEPNEKLQEMFDEYEKLQINNKLFDISKIIESYMQILQSKKNIILHGAPGTGKTYTARQIAAQMMFDKTYDKLTEEEQNQIGFVQFHPSYDYTDFVEGLRPIEKSQNEVGFTRTNGVFKDFCEKAISAKEQKFVFIIDEINRGDISKIFGELFFSIDPSYRGTTGRVATQYQNLIKDTDTFKKGFFIPENVYIIGTMNDIDRSVESMDFAMRRRFDFYEVTAKDSANAMGVDYSDNSPLKRLNDAIEKKLGIDYQIGGAYFKDYKDILTDQNKLHELWDRNLKGLLKEYLRGQRDAKETLSHFESVFYGTDTTN